MLDARDLPDGQRLAADICIIGAGAAGVALALELQGSGIDVLLVEAEGLTPEGQPAEARSGDAKLSRAQTETDRIRREAFGGAGFRRGFPCLELTPIEFEARPYLPFSGWPIAAGELAPYYAKALQFCEAEASARFRSRVTGLATAQQANDLFRNRHFAASPPDPYSPHESFSLRHAGRLKSPGNVCVLLRATVTHLQLNEAGRAVDHAVVRTRSDRRLFLNAERFVLAAGTLGTTRLLLGSRDVQKSGIGNEQDQVGRFYSAPLSGTVEGLSLDRRANSPWLSRPDDPKVYAGRRHYFLRPDTQHRLGLSPVQVRLIRLKDPAGGLLSRLLARSIDAVGFVAEQRPNAASRVSHGDSRDRFGLPNILVDWHGSIEDFESLHRALKLFSADLESDRAGCLDIGATWLAEAIGQGAARSDFAVGTARMGRDRRSSVVDPDGRLHGVENLFVTGTPVFPTSGCGDPLLTCVALAQRLGAHLRRLESKDDIEARIRSRQQEPLRGEADPGSSEVKPSRAAEGGS